MNEYTAKDFKKGQPRWCPGCGDHFFLASLHKAMAELGVAPHDTAVISGIGCSSRLPYYMNTYAMQTVHGRAAAISTGCKVANPKITVWQISGDGDGLAIGGNHFIHAVRRNIDLNMILLNNRIYGLTKGQYSPTSPRGFVSKSSPYGTVEDPFHPAELCFGARGRFFARALMDANTTLEQKVQERTQELKTANIELEKLARHDALTGLYNRRALTDYLDYLYAQFTRSHVGYAVLLLDVDYFKKVNDQYGHEVGDRVLKGVAQVLSSNIRESDFVARYGGEEFVVLLPTTTLEGAMVLAENLRQTVEQAPILDQHPISISIGVSVVQVTDSDAQTAMRRADQHLYQAKAQGRNRVVAL